MSGHEYTESQLISQSEETMRPQLMCCALPNPSSSQFRTEVRVNRGECPKEQGLWKAYSFGRLSAKGSHPEYRADLINGRTGVRVDMKSEQDFVVVDFGGRTSDTTNDRNVRLVGVGVDILVEDSELDFCPNGRMTGVGDEYTLVEYLIGNQGCR